MSAQFRRRLRSILGPLYPGGWGGSKSRRPKMAQLGLCPLGSRVQTVLTSPGSRPL